MPSKCLFLFKFHLLSSCKANSFHLTPMPKWPWCSVHAKFPLDRMHICYLQNTISSWFCLRSGLRDWVSFASLLAHVLFLSKKKQHEPRRSWKTWHVARSCLFTLQTKVSAVLWDCNATPSPVTSHCVIHNFVFLYFTNLRCLGPSRGLCYNSSVFSSL